jgi:hypothetical protein
VSLVVIAFSGRIFIIGKRATCVKPRGPERFATISLSSTA